MHSSTHLLPRCSHSPATLSHCSAPPSAHIDHPCEGFPASNSSTRPSTWSNPFTGRGHQPHCPDLGPSSSSPQLQAIPPPHRASSPLPWAPSQPLARGQGSTKGSQQTASVYSDTHITIPRRESAPGLRAPNAPPATGTPRRLFPEPHSSGQQGTVSQSVGSWSNGLLGRAGDCQK